MQVKTDILTPEQMRAKLAGQPIPPTEVQQATIIGNRTQATVEKLAKKLEAMKATTKMTPAELRQGLDALFTKYNFSPAEELIRTSQETDDVSLATRINMFLLEFVLPKLKSVEVSGSIDHNHVVVIRRFGIDGQVQDSPAIPQGRITQAIDAEVVA